MIAKQLCVSDDEDEDDEKPDIATIEKLPEAENEGEETEETPEGDVEPKIKADPDGNAAKGSKKHNPMELRIYSEDELASMSRDRLVADVSILEGAWIGIARCAISHDFRPATRKGGQCKAEPERTSRISPEGERIPRARQGIRASHETT